MIPQLADAGEVLDRIDSPDDVSISVLIPNEQRARERARGSASASTRSTSSSSASETHNRKNVNRSIEESLTGLERVLARARGEGLRCEGVISTSLRLPLRGRRPARARLRDRRAGSPPPARRRSASATPPGWPTPPRSREFFPPRREALAPSVELTAHFHNTRGQGLANVLAALEAGVDSFESSFGELGGCPVPPGATGNIATEDLVSMLHEMGIETGIELERLVAAARAAQEVLGRPLGSHVLTAGPVEWH